MNNNSPYLLNNPQFSERLKENAQEHHIEGMLYKHFSSYQNNKIFKSRWFAQWQYTLNLRSEVKKLGDLLQGQLQDDLIILKGMALTDLIYNDYGSRFMSDIDLLASKEDCESIFKALKVMGYTNNIHKIWKGNGFKSEWVKVFDGYEINFEIHSALFYHTKPFQIEVTNFSIAPYKVLAIEDLVIHLCGHLVFQHTFLKLYWLFDILLLMNSNTNIDWSKVALKSKKNKVYKSVQMTLYIFDHYFKNEITISPDLLKLFQINHFKIWMFFLDKELLLNPNHSGMKFWIIKHLTKDHLLEAFSYDVYWLTHKVKERILKK